VTRASFPRASGMLFEDEKCPGPDLRRTQRVVCVAFVLRIGLSRHVGRLVLARRIASILFLGFAGCIIYLRAWPREFSRVGHGLEGGGSCGELVRARVFVQTCDRAWHAWRAVQVFGREGLARFVFPRMFVIEKGRHQ